MVSENAYLSDLHFEHKVWMNELNFFEDEILTFEHRLEELARQYLPKREVMVDLEHFQNRFIRQKEVINQLKHEVRMHEQYLVQLAAANPTSVDQPKVQDHVELRERMETFRKLYLELKNEFFQYAAKWI
jgi:3-deoxy-D-arabino-heptulosonate 7-phosphate (DAHP) synthase